MATTEAFTRPSDLAEEEFQYRPLSVGAIVALVLGLLSPLTFLAGSESLAGCLMMSPIPALGIFVGLKAWVRIRSTPDQASGGKLAATGVLLSLVGLVGGLGYASYVYATEVPPGYVRTSFDELRPDEVEQRGDLLVPRDLQKLAGQKVFIKGFMRPGSSPVRTNVRQFLLVRDNNQCCFGDISSLKYFDQVLVSTVGSLSTDYSTGIYRVGGTLHLHPENIVRGVGYPVYTLEADHLE
jgi:hypothetical protein